MWLIEIKAFIDRSYWITLGQSNAHFLSPPTPHTFIPFSQRRWSQISRNNFLRLNSYDSLHIDIQLKSWWFTQEGKAAMGLECGIKATCPKCGRNSGEKGKKQYQKASYLTKCLIDGGNSVKGIVSKSCWESLQWQKLRCSVKKKSIIRIVQYISYWPMVLKSNQNVQTKHCGCCYVFFRTKCCMMMVILN